MNFSLIYLFLITVFGIITAFILPLPLARWLKILVGPALGIIIITQVTLVVCIGLGFTQTSVILTLLIYILAMVLTMLYLCPNILNSSKYSRLNFRKLISALKQNYLFLI